jgi:hypothetical protein
MEDVGILLALSGLSPDTSPPSHILVIIASNRVEILLEGIHKGYPGGFSPKWHRFIHRVPLPITFPPIFDMGKGFKEHKGDIFTIRKILDRVITF